jgi:cytochrome c biogenesis protein CcmG/thiol:disulfide interchange protein DsbE
VAGLLSWLVPALFLGSSSLIPVGRPAPALEGQALDGQPWAANLTGEITIVEFFATWCPKCRQSLPDHRALAAARQVRLIIVDVDEDPALVQAFFAREPPPPDAGVLVDRSGSARQNWGVTGFPSVYVIDKAGIIRGRFAGWNDTCARELAERIDSIRRAEKRAVAAVDAAAKRPGSAPAGSARRGRGKAPQPRDRGISPDEHARQLGVEVIR